MKKKMLIPIFVCALLLSACGGGVSAAEESSSTVSSAATDVTVAPDAPASNNDALGEEGRTWQDNQIMGRITAVADGEITIELASMGGRPDGRESGSGREAPVDGGEFPAGSLPERNGEPGQRPEGGNGGPGGRGGNGGGFPMGAPEYTGETATYAVAADAVIQKGAGENTAKLTFSDLADGDIVRLLLNEDEQIVSIIVTELPADSGAEPAATE